MTWEIVVLVQEGKDLQNGCVILKRISPFSQPTE